MAEPMLKTTETTPATVDLAAEYRNSGAPRCWTNSTVNSSACAP
jgi:hypothetical protein